MSYFIAPDAHEEPTLWRVHHPDPVAVVSRRQLRDDPAVWDAVVRFASGADHLPQRMADHLGIGDR